MIRLFAIAHDKDFDVHPHALRAIRRDLRRIGPDVREDPEANKLFLDILTGPKNPETTLRRMNEAGVLGRFVPDFGRVVAQMQYDMYHWYTVDEHTLQAMGILHRIAAGEMKDELPLASELIQQIASHRALSVALLLHDIAKGRGGDHSVLGAKVAQLLGPRLGLSPEEVETASWLVRWHLAMSDAAFKRDLEDEETVRAFAELVQSPERLKLLAILTSTDIRAGRPRPLECVEVGVADRTLSAHRRMARDFERRTSHQPRPCAHRCAQRKYARAVARLGPIPNSIGLRGLGRAATGSPSILPVTPTTPSWRAKRNSSAVNSCWRPATTSGATSPKSPSMRWTIPACSHGWRVRLPGPASPSSTPRFDTLTNGMALDVFSVQDASGSALEGETAREKLTRSVERAAGGQAAFVERAGPQALVPAAPRAFVSGHAARVDRQWRVQVPHRDRDQRPRPRRPVARVDHDLDPLVPVDRDREDLDLRAQGSSTCSMCATCSA